MVKPCRRRALVLAFSAHIRVNYFRLGKTGRTAKLAELGALNLLSDKFISSFRLGFGLSVNLLWLFGFVLFCQSEVALGLGGEIRPLVRPKQINPYLFGSLQIADTN